MHAARMDFLKSAYFLINYFGTTIKQVGTCFVCLLMIHFLYISTFDLKSEVNLSDMVTDNFFGHLLLSSGILVSIHILKFSCVRVGRGGLPLHPCTSASSMEYHQVFFPLPSVSVGSCLLYT